MKKLLIFALLCAMFVFAPQVNASGAQPFLVCTWNMPGMVDYIDYIPGEYVIGRGSEFDAAGNFVRYCSFDTLAVSDLLLRGEYETDVIGMIDDTLANLCDSAAFAEAFETKFGMRYRASVECNETRKVFSVLPVEIFKNALNLPMDTLMGSPMLGKVIKDTLAAPGMYGPYKRVPLERNDLVRFYCDSSCYMYTIDYWTYVESGDSVLLCHKDSVLRRNGVCMDLRALRDTAGSVNVRPFPKEDDASVDSAPRVAGTTKFSRFGSMLKMEIAKAGMLEVSAVDGKILRRAPVLPGERWLDLSAFAPGFLAVRVGGASTSLYWEGAAK